MTGCTCYSVMMSMRVENDVDDKIMPGNQIDFILMHLVMYDKNVGCVLFCFTFHDDMQVICINKMSKNQFLLVLLVN